MMYIVGVLILLFIWLTISVALSKNAIVKFDTNILSYYHNIQNKTLDFFFETITWLGSLWILLPLYMVLLAFLFKTGYKNILVVSLMFFGAVITTNIVKYMIDRKRPDIFETIGDLPFDPSYPSGHTTQVTIFSLILVFLLFEYGLSNKLIYCFFIFMICSLVISSRMYLQVHYFSDILGGILVAFIWFLLGLKFMGRV